MSHSVTIRTHTVTTSSSTIVINTGYIKTWSGLLKLLELAFGIICVGIIGNEFNSYYYRYMQTPECFFLVTTSAFLIGTFIIFLSCLLSHSTTAILSKSLYELLYHSIAFALLFAASLTLILHVNNYRRQTNRYELLLGASICGFINTVLYLASTIIALRGYRSL